MPKRTQRPLTPAQVIDRVITDVKNQLDKAVGSHEIFTPPIQAYLAGAVGRIIEESIKVSNASQGGAKDRRTQQDVQWNLEYRTRPVPRPGFGGPTSTEAQDLSPRQAPDEGDLIMQLAAENPDLLKYEPWEFTGMVARTLHSRDPRWGRKSRPNGPVSRDSIAFIRDDGKYEVVDTIVGSGSGNPRPGWRNVGVFTDREVQWHQP